MTALVRAAQALPVLLATSAILLSCTDPVEGPAAPGGASTEAPSAAAPPSRARAADHDHDDGDHDDRREREREPARGEREAQSPPADTVAADVAAGLEDGGVPVAGDDAPGAGSDTDTVGDPGSEPSAFVRPVIHADVIENFRILRFALAEDVIEREPVMISSRFRHNSGPMHVFMEVQNQTADDVTLIVGFRRASNDRRGGGVSLTIPPAPRYRTRARGNTRRAVGEWVCEVMDEHQRVLVTQPFFITEEAPADATPAN